MRLGAIVYSCVAVVCAAYAVFIFLTNSGTVLFAVWLVVALIGILGAILLQYRIWERLGSFVHSCIVGLGTIVLLLIIVTWGLQFSQFGAVGQADLDYIIVLGAQVTSSGPTTATRYRLDTALHYLDDNPKTIVIVSGGQVSKDPVTEGEVMQAYLIKNGLDSSRIIVEDKSTNTASNIANSAQFIDIEHDSVGIVTNNFHLWRALALARHDGYLYICGIAADSNLLYLPNNMLRETLGILKDLFVGNIL